MNNVPERRSYRLAYLTLGALAIVLLLTAGAVIFSYKGNSASQDVRESTLRADCRSQYNTDLTTTKEIRDDLKLELDSQFYGALLKPSQGQVVTQADKDLFAETKQKLDIARAAWSTQIKLPAAVENGYILNGVHHPPCPG